MDIVRRAWGIGGVEGAGGMDLENFFGDRQRHPGSIS